MHKPSGFVMPLALAALAVVICSGGAVLYFTRMPDPQTADLRGLLRWLVTRDLSQESETTQEVLLSRIEYELQNGLELSSAGDQLTESQRALLATNADLLGQRWFAKLVDRYSALTAAQKPDFLNQQIDDVQRSGMIKALSTITGEGSKNPQNPWNSLTRRVGRWISRMEPPQRSQAEKLVAAVEGNLFLRTLKSPWLWPAALHPAVSAQTSANGG
jgi:hypothetical protein